MAGKEPTVGPTSRTVAENVKRQREARNLSFAQLSDKLATDAQWPISPVTIRRIETGERRCTPDDLAALAVAFKISPITLLMPGLPDAEDPAEGVEATGLDAKVSATMLWKWLSADPDGGSLVGLSPYAFVLAAQPQWEHARWFRDDSDGR